MLRKGFPDGTSGKEPACQCRRPETRVRSLGWVDPLEEGMATHSSILAWRIPTDRGAWWATVHRVAKSRTELKWLSTQHRRWMRGTNGESWGSAGTSKLWFCKVLFLPKENRYYLTKTPPKCKELNNFSQMDNSRKKKTHHKMPRRCRSSRERGSLNRMPILFDESGVGPRRYSFWKPPRKCWEPMKFDNWCSRCPLLISCQV